ncbi:MAG: hypothetical protein P4L50_02495 [Anaerolineaceae bacterium]|nr:hypothetical protein [Anaerolineaceae bacterium]
MKRSRLLIAALLLLVPLIARTLWYYQGIYQRTAPVATPDYAHMTASQPTLATPVSVTTVSPVDSKILIDMAHNNLFSLSEIAPLTRSLENDGAQIDTYTGSSSLTNDLKHTDSFIVITPLQPFTSPEMDAISHFIDQGGRMLVITDPTRNNLSGSSGTTNSTTTVGQVNINGVDVANLFLAPFGIAFNNDYVYNLTSNEGNFRNVIYEQFTSDPLTKNVSQVVLYSAHSLVTSQTALIQGDQSTLSSLTDQGGELAVGAIASHGQVLALGNLTFMINPYNQVADNSRFIQNIADFLVGSKKSLILADFPYLFKRPVTILTTGGIQKDSSLLSTISQLQKAVAAQNLTIQISDQPVQGNDLLVLGTFPPGQDLDQFISPFNLVYTAEANPVQNIIAPTVLTTPISGTTHTNLSTPASDQNQAGGGILPAVGTVKIPDFGEFSTDGIGIVLYSSLPNHNTLVLIAATPSGLGALANLITQGDLAGCTIQGNAALCNLGSTAGGSK